MSLVTSSLSMTAVVFGQTANNTTTTATEAQRGEKVIPPSTTVTKFVDDTGLTINQVPPGWTIVDEDNTSPEEAALELKVGTATLATLCPPYSKAAVTDEYFNNCAEPNYGQIFITSYPALDKQESFVQSATVVNPDTGLLELNLTAQALLDYTTSPYFEMVVQKKTVSVNTTNPNDGTSQQVPGLLVLFTNPTELNLSKVGFYFVDNTTGYSMTVIGPVGTPEEALPGFTTAPDPRGESIPIHGIGLDNLPPVMDEPLQIINSVSITRK